MNIRTALTYALAVVLAITLAFYGAASQAVQAQASPYCDTTVSVTAAAAASATVAGAVPGATVFVCAYDISGDTAATGLQWKSGSTNLSGVELGAANGHFTAGTGGSILIQAPTSGGLTIAATTGAIAGWVRMGQH